MSRAREITLTFFFMYLSCLKPKACAAKIDFLNGFYKNLSFKIAMSRLASCVESRPRFWLPAWKNPCVMLLGTFLYYNTH